MNATTTSSRRWFRGRTPKVHSIRTKLVFAFGVLLGLGSINIAVYYWGSSQRSLAFETLQRAIERQIIITDVANLLEDQKRYVDLLSGVIGVEAAEPPSEAERAQFAQGVDAVTVRLRDMIAETEPDRTASIEALYEKTDRLVMSWKKFYDFQWTDASKAVEELYVRAEPLSEELLTADLPAVVQAEKNHLAEGRKQFILTDQTNGRLTWLCFILSALIGSVLAFFISRDLLHAIAALKTGAGELGSGLLDHRIDIPNRDELGEVAQSFNLMAERLSERNTELAAQRKQIEAQRDDLTRTLSDLKETQAQLVQQEKMASLGQLTAGIAHEIKNPLNFVNNFAELNEELAGEAREALDEGDAEEAQAILADLKTNAAQISKHGKRADAIVQSMMQHAGSGKGQRVMTDLNALVDEYLTLVCSGFSAKYPNCKSEFERHFDENLPRVAIIPQDFGRVLINLLNNAFEALVDKKNASPESYVPRVILSTRAADGWAEIRIADNGTGIPAEIIRQIFEPFFTTKPTGQGNTGLGLSLSFDMIHQGHGGSLTVESEEGAGATFIISLPIRSDAGEPAEEETAVFART